MPVLIYAGERFAISAYDAAKITERISAADVGTRMNEHGQRIWDSDGSSCVTVTTPEGPLTINVGPSVPIAVLGD